MKQKTIKKSIMQILFGIIFALTTVVSVALMQTSNLTAFAASSYMSGTLNYTGSEWTIAPDGGTLTTLVEGDEVLNGYYDPQNTEMVIYTNGFLGGSRGSASGVVAKIDGSTLYFCKDKDGHAQNKDATTKLCPNCSIHTVADIVKNPNVELPEGADQIIPIVMWREGNNWGEDGKTSWYVFDGYSGAYGKMNGDVNLILLDGKATESVSITRGTNGNLTIWGEKEGTGKLSYSNYYNPKIDMDGGTLTINGGTLEFSNTYSSGAIKATTVNINGGTVITKGRNGIYAETINIATGAEVLAGSSEGEAVAPTFNTDWKTTLSDKDYVKITGPIGPVHIHTWSYVLNNNTLTATSTCHTSEECEDFYGVGEKVVSLTLNVDSKTYDGSAVVASYEDKSAWANVGLPVPTIVYEAKTNSALTDNNAVNAGSYTAKATVIDDADSYTLTKDFNITKATASEFSVSIVSWVEGETPFDATVTGNVSEGNVTYEYKVKDADDSTYTATKPTKAGYYTVRATVAESDNYQTATATANFVVGGIPVSGETGNQDAGNGNNSNVAIIIVLAVLAPVAFCAGFFKDAIAKFCVRLFKKKS